MTARSNQAVTHYGQPLPTDYRHLCRRLSDQPEHSGAGRRDHADPVQRRAHCRQADDQPRPAQRSAAYETAGAKHSVRHRHRARAQCRGHSRSHDRQRQPQVAAAVEQVLPAPVSPTLKLALLDFRVLTGAGSHLALRVLDLHRRELRRGITHHQDRKRQQQNPAAQVDDAQVRRVVVRHVGDQQAGQGGDRHVDQKPHGHVVGLDLVAITHTCHRVDFHHC